MPVQSFHIFLIRPVTYVLLTVLLAACALADMPVRDVSPAFCQCITPTPLPPPVINSTCQQPLEFERWLQRASRLRAEVGMIFDSREAIPAEKLIMLQDMQTAIINLTPPDCATQANRLLLDAVSGALMALEGGGVDSTALLQQSQTRLAAFDMLYEYLLQQLGTDDMLPK